MSSIDSSDSSMEVSREYTIQCLSELISGGTLLKAGRSVSHHRPIYSYCDIYVAIYIYNVLPCVYSYIASYAIVLYHDPSGPISLVLNS